MDDSRVETLTVARRFRGPDSSGNGGYTAGLLAEALSRAGDDEPGAVEVTLRRPPPLDTPMEVRRTDGVLTVHDGDHLVAEARPGQLRADPVEAVSVGDARHAETTYAGLTSHPFPRCFTCGPDRVASDGLRLYPGRLGDGRTACTWTPDKSLCCDQGPRHVCPQYVWAALDCPGGWTADLEGRPMVLGRITARIDAAAEVGERHVVMGRLLGQQGRRTLTATTVYDSDGRVVARAEHVWVAVDPGAFG
jgi:hypothetical protein